jgi:small GTP-binding protein
MSVNKLTNPYPVKCLFAGESGTGKTTLIRLIVKGEQGEVPEPTIGMAFSVKTVQMTNADGTLQLARSQNWDAAGSPRFRSIVTSYMRELDIAFLVFDMNKRETWEELVRWKKQIDEINENSPLPQYVIIGNKSDIHKYQVDDYEIQEKCREWNCKRYILSCVESNSVGMANRMYCQSILELHKYLLKCEKLPERFKPGFKKEFFQIMDDSKQTQCCSVQ